MRNYVQQIKAQVVINFTGFGVKKVAMRYNKTFHLLGVFYFVRITWYSFCMFVMYRPRQCL
jgi:hypothetical protein